MDNVIVYNNVKDNIVSLRKEDYDYTVCINNEEVMSTGDMTEAEMVAESLDVALSILDNHNLLRKND